MRVMTFNNRLGGVLSAPAHLKESSARMLSSCRNVAGNAIRLMLIASLSVVGFVTLGAPPIAQAAGDTDPQPEFVMDAEFSVPQPVSSNAQIVYNTFPQSYPADSRFQYVDLPFSLSHAKDSADGPDSVSFELDFSQSWTSPFDVSVRDNGCAPMSNPQTRYPFSGEGHEAERTTRFPGCSVEKLGATKLKLTLSGLDYSAGPAKYSTDTESPNPDHDVIAAGLLTLKVPYTERSTLQMTASTPTYTSVTGDTSTDNSVNNTAKVQASRIRWSGGWALSAQHPNPYEGQPWQGNFKARAGETVMSVGSVKVPTGVRARDNWVCKVLDTKYVTFQDARVAIDGYAQPNLYYDESYTGDIWYYTGEIEDPNAFACGTKTVTGKSAEGNPEGWTTVKPADPSMVKAVKVQVPGSLAGKVTADGGSVWLVVDQQIKPEVTPGTDIWSWTYALEEGDNDWRFEPESPTGQHFHRSSTPPINDFFGVTTAGKRYAYAAEGRDMITVAEPAPTESPAPTEPPAATVPAESPSGTGAQPPSGGLAESGAESWMTILGASTVTLLAGGALAAIHRRRANQS